MTFCGSPRSECAVIFHAEEGSEEGVNGRISSPFLEKCSSDPLLKKPEN